MDYKPTIVTSLKAMVKLARDEKEKFKVIAYSKVLKQLAEHNDPIHSMDDLKDIKGIGKGIKNKLAEIFETGKLARADVFDPTMEALVDMFSEVMCIGPVKARELVYEHKLKTIDELNARPDLLNDKQKIGLKYYDDFKERIPRKEMDVHNEYLTKIIAEISPNTPFQVAGSYRRGAANSGDIDLLVSSCDPNFIPRVVAMLGKYVTDTFASGTTKFMGACRLPRRRLHRRLDIVCIPPHEYAFALLYFTGSQAHNIAMRKQALSLGYTLNEHGIKSVTTDEPVVDKIFNTEQDIFDFLKMEYKEPKDRV
jgi:DNA polymerase/3'-5' exonuclease PolX